MNDVYSERPFSRETRISAWFSNSFAGAGVQFPAPIVLWPAFVERAVLKPGEGFKHKNYTRWKDGLSARRAAKPIPPLRGRSL